MMTCTDCNASGPWACGWQEAVDAANHKPKEEALRLWNLRANGESSGRTPCSAIERLRTALGLIDKITPDEVADYILAKMVRESDVRMALAIRTEKLAGKQCDGSEESRLRYEDVADYV